jgi:hypothetical protein
MIALEPRPCAGKKEVVSLMLKAFLSVQMLLANNRMSKTLLPCRRLKEME